MFSRLIGKNTFVCRKNSIVNKYIINFPRFSTTSRHNLIPDNIDDISSQTSTTNNSSSSSTSTASNDSSNSNKSMGTAVTVNAYYIARRIDLVKAHSGIYSKLKKSRLEEKSVTIEIDKAANQYVSVFSFGSVILFNIPFSQHIDHLKRIRESAIVTPLIPGNIDHIDKYKIIINPNLERPSVIKAEHVNIRSLDNKNIAIISTVIAQSVALDYYAETVDTMLDSFMKINMNIEKTGNFEDLRATGLYQLVAVNNRVFVTVLSRLGIFEGSDAAWENNDYHDTFEALRKDFEIELRYKDLSLKLDIVKDNTQFFLEILNNRQSTNLEWTIIILIAVEIVIGLCGLIPPGIIVLPGSTATTAVTATTAAAVTAVAVTDIK